jgi:hypothetical protein
MGLIGAGLIGVGLSGGLALAAVAIGVTQAGFAIYGSSSLSLVQSLSPARLRGRVTAVHALYRGCRSGLAGASSRSARARSSPSTRGPVVIVCGSRCSSCVPRRGRRIDRAAGTVTGRLEGSGYAPPARPVATPTLR